MKKKDIEIIMNPNGRRYEEITEVLQRVLPEVQKMISPLKEIERLNNVLIQKDMVISHYKDIEKIDKDTLLSIKNMIEKNI